MKLERNSLLSELADTKAELEAKKTSLLELGKGLAEAKAERVQGWAWEAKMAEKDGTIDDLKGKVLAAEERAKKSTGEVTRLKMKLNRMDTLESQLNEANIKLTQSKKNLDYANATNMDSQFRLVENQNALDKLTMEYSDLQRRYEDLSDQVWSETGGDELEEDQDTSSMNVSANSVDNMEDIFKIMSHDIQVAINHLLLII